MEGKKVKRLNRKNFKIDYSEERILLRIELFDEPVLRNILLDEFHRTFPQNDKGYKAAKIKELQRQIAELENGIDNVEA